MYLLKNISFDAMNKNVIVENGIKICVKNNNTLVYLPYSFWGETQIDLGKYIDFSKFEKLDDNGSCLLSYVNEYISVPIVDNFRKLIFNVSTYQEDKIEGYIIFLEHGENIKTNGERLFGRYYDEIVVVLKEKDFLEFEGKRIEVVNNNLVLLI